MTTAAKQVSQFAIVGGIGFVADASVLAVLHYGLGMGLVGSRIISFAVAVTLTWYLNRHNTFSEQKDDRAAREWSRYATVHTFGAAINMAIFFTLVQQYELMKAKPLIALAIASGVVMFVNFFVSKYIAFTGNRH